MWGSMNRQCHFKKQEIGNQSLQSCSWIRTIYCKNKICGKQTSYYKGRLLSPLTSLPRMYCLICWTSAAVNSPSACRVWSQQLKREGAFLSLHQLKGIKACQANSQGFSSRMSFSRATSNTVQNANLSFLHASQAPSCRLLTPSRGRAWCLAWL